MSTFWYVANEAPVSESLLELEPELRTNYSSASNSSSVFMDNSTNMDLKAVEYPFKPVKSFLELTGKLLPMKT